MKFHALKTLKKKIEEIETREMVRPACIMYTGILRPTNGMPVNETPLQMEMEELMGDGYSEMMPDDYDEDEADASFSQT